MNEELFARNITSGLERGLSRLSPDIARKLERARTLALSHAQPNVTTHALHSAHGLSLIGSWVRHHRTGAMVSLLTVLLLAILGLWQNSSPNNSDTTDVDAALLTGDLPVNAYLDNHLNQQWENHNSN